MPKQTLELSFFAFVFLAQSKFQVKYCFKKTEETSHTIKNFLATSIMAAELEDTLKRLVQNKAVIGTMVTNSDGIPIKSTLEVQVATQYSGLINQLVDQGRVRKGSSGLFIVHNNLATHFSLSRD